MNRPIPLRPDYSGSLQTERRSWQRAIAAHVIATVQRSEPHKILKAAWPNDERAHMITRGAVTPTTTADLWTFDPTIAYRSLAPSSAALALFQMGLALNLEGVSTIRIPSVAGLPVRPVFVDEGQPAPTVQWNFAADTVLGPARKILLLSAVSKELENSAPETVSAVIGRVLADCANGSIDATAFGTTAADDATPAGLLHGVTPIAAAAAGPDAMYEDLGNLTGAIGAAGIDPTGAVFVTGPREATIIKAKVGAKFDFPVLMTLALPSKSVAAFAPAGVASGYQDQPQIETSDKPALHFEDTDPTDISGTGGGRGASEVSVPDKPHCNQGSRQLRLGGRIRGGAGDHRCELVKPWTKRPEMDAATQRQWEAWANALVQAKLQAFAEIMGEEAARQEKRMLTHFNAELKRLDDRIAALQAELEILRARNVTPPRIAAHVA